MQNSKNGESHIRNKQEDGIKGEFCNLIGSPKRGFRSAGGYVVKAAT